MKWYYYLKLAVYIAFSVILFVFKDFLVDNLDYFVGSLFIAYGIVGILENFLFKRKDFYKQLEFVQAFVGIILGILLYTVIKYFDNVCIVWAVWSLFRESVEIYEVINKEVTGWAAILTTVESIVAITFAILLIITPTEHHASIHIYLLIAELMATSLPPVVNDLIKKYRKNEPVESE